MGEVLHLRIRKAASKVLKYCNQFFIRADDRLCFSYLCFESGTKCGIYAPKSSRKLIVSQNASISITLQVVLISILVPKFKLGNQSKANNAAWNAPYISFFDFTDY